MRATIAPLKPIEERWLSPQQQPTPRASATIIAKGAAKNTTHIAALEDGSLLVAHHGGLASSPGGLDHRAADGSLIASRAGVSGPIDASGASSLGWLASGPLHKGEHAALCVIEPERLTVRETFALARPFGWLSESVLFAHTPSPNGEFAKKTCEYTRLPGFRAERALLARTKLPEEPGLVAFDVATREARLLIEASPHDAFQHAALSSDRATLFGASRYGRIVALRLSDATVLWERPAVRDSARFALLAFALSADETQLVCAGSGSPYDCLVLDAATGAVRREFALRAAVVATGLARKPASRLSALAFHREGHFAVGTNAGAIILARNDGRMSAWKAGSTPVAALAFTRDGTALVSGSHEECLRVWQGV